MTLKSLPVNYINNVRVLVKPFIIGGDLPNLIIKKGQTIKYDVKFGGEPQPEIIWMQETREVHEDGEKRYLKILTLNNLLRFCI